MPDLSTVVSLFQKNRFREAEQAIKPLLAQSNHGSDCCHLAAVIAMRLGQRETAFQRIERAIVLNHQNAEYWNTRGAILLERKKLELSFESFSKALELSPDYREAKRNLGLPLKSAGKWSAAEKVFEEATRRFPDDHQSWLHLAEARLQNRRISEAIAASQAAIKLRPQAIPGHFWLMRALLAGQYFAAAEEALNEAEKSCGPNSQLSELKAIFLAKTNRAGESIELFKELYEQNRTSLSAAVNYALALLESGREQEFQQQLESIERLSFPDPSPLIPLADALAERDRLHEASQQYQRALSAAPDEVTAKLGLMRIAFQNADDHRCRQLLDGLDRATVVDFEIDLLQAKLAIRHDQTDRAIQFLRRALAVDPNHTTACRMLAEQLLKSSGIIGAIAGHGSPRRLRLEEALAVTQRALREVEDVELLYLQAKALHSLQRPEEAIPCLHEAILLDARDPRFFHLLGLCHLDMGQIEESRDSFRQALEIDPHHAPAHYHLAISEKPERPAKQIEVLTKELGQSDLTPRNEMLFRMSLGRAYDAAEEYELAMQQYLLGNGLKPRPNLTEPEEAMVVRHDHFMEEIASLFDRDFFLARTDYGNESHRPLFIVGMPRSGTTLTEQILASHPDVHGAGELQEIGAWPNQIERLVRDRPLRYPYAASDLKKDQVAQLARRHLRLLARYSTEARYVTDKMPTNFLHLGMISLMFPHAKIIHCCRDPRDVAVSCLRQNLDWPFCDPEQLGRYLMAYRKLMRHWHEVLPNAIFDLSYEALARSPAEQIRQLLDFCELSWNEDCLNFQNSGRAVITPSKTQVRKPIYTSSIGTWKRYQTTLGPLLDGLESLILC